MPMYQALHSLLVRFLIFESIEVCLQTQIRISISQEARCVQVLALSMEDPIPLPVGQDGILRRINTGLLDLIHHLMQPWRAPNARSGALRCIAFVHVPSQIKIENEG